MAEALQVLSLAPDRRARIHADSLRVKMPPAARLSMRAREVLALMARGLRNAGIANEMVVSPPTARFHIETILGKLGAANRAQAVALGVQHGLIPDNSAT